MNPEEVDPFSSTPFTSPQATAFAGTDNHSSPTQQKESEPVADLLEGYGEQTPKNSTVFTHQQSPTSSAAITNRPVPLAISHDPLQNDDDLAPSTTAAAAAAALTGDGQLESSRNSSSSYLPPLAEKTTESATADANDATAATATDVDQLTDALKKQQKIRSSSSVNLKHPIVLDLPVPHSSFRITVGDPMTVGEGLKAHTEYNIISQSDLENLKGQEFSVRRRFKEFLWLYQQLSNKYPGVIVPPPPEKHALGRFEEEFVENRRVQLERMLRKIGAHSVLQKDVEFHSFLTAQAFEGEIQEKKPKQSFISKLGDAMSGASSAFHKMQEVDEWFDVKKAYLDQLESQLKLLAKAIDNLVRHRDEVAETTEDFGEAVFALASAEINKSAEKHLNAFGDVQRQIRQVHQQQARSDVFYLANTIDEYIRLIGSIRSAFSARLKSYQTWQTAEHHLVKLRISLEKTKLNSKTKPEKVSQIESEIIDAESKIISTKKEFEEISRVLKEEMALFERDKIDDINAAMQGYLDAVIKHQQSMVDVWEGYFKAIESDN